MEKTETKKYRYPWHEAPHWAAQAATDASGKAYWYGAQAVGDQFESTIMKVRLPDLKTSDWRDSIEMRPPEFQTKKPQND